MSRVKILIAIFICTFTYASLSFVAGKNGLWVYRQLLEQKKEIARQTDAIQSINSELKLEYNALSKDMDVVAAYARKLDYVSEGEKLVKISGLRPYESPLYDTGTVLRHRECAHISEKMCKITALVMGLLSFVLMFLYDLSRGNIRFGEKNTVCVKGIPIYEVPQI